MRRFVALLLAFSFSAGCYTMRIAAPAGQNVTTPDEATPATLKKEVKVWYALWGLVPITDNSTAPIIAQNNLKNVRVTTQHKFVDFVIGFFTSIVSIVPATMTVEGTP